MRKERDKIELIYEDRDLIVIEKCSGLITYPTGEFRSESAIQSIRRIWRARRSGEQFLYLLHRLDMDTSGLLVFAKTSMSRKYLQEQFEQHQVIRCYVAVTDGIPQRPSGTIQGFLGRNLRGKRSVRPEGRFASTSYEVITENQSRNRALVRCRLLTGRTHQVRIHLAHIGAPVVGDRIYGKRGNRSGQRLALHGNILGFIHPRSKTPFVFVSSLPQELKELLR